MKFGKTSLSGTLMVGLLASVSATSVSAEDFFGAKKSQSPALDNFSIWLGGYYANNDTTLKAKTNVLNSSASVNFEDDLGFEKKKTVPRARFDFLIGAHQGFSVDYYRIDRSHGREVADAGNVLGQDVEGAASVKGRLNFDFGSVAYKWWFGTGNDVFGLGIGAAHYKVYGKVSAEASVDALGTGARYSASTDGDAQAWAPNLQIGWRHAFSDNTRLYFNASGVKRGGGNGVYGHIYDAALGLEWFPSAHIGVGVEYAYTDIDLSKDKRYDGGETLNYNLKMKLNGPAAYLRMRF